MDGGPFGATRIIRTNYWRGIGKNPNLHICFRRFRWDFLYFLEIK